MKNLKESLLGDLEDNLKSGDNIIKNPFKYLANLSKTEINSREKYKKELEYFETSIESQCKVKEWQKGKNSKYVLGINYNNMLLNYQIFIKDEKDIYVLMPNSNSLIGWDLHKHISRSSISRNWEKCEKLYIMPLKLVDQFEEFCYAIKKVNDLNNFKKLPDEALQFWERYKK